MTLPKDVQENVWWLDGRGRDDAWTSVRRHLMRQEAIIGNAVDALALANEKVLVAESSLAMADALLREAIGWNWLDDGAPRPDVMDVLDQKIQAHLQGAGDE